MQFVLYPFCGWVRATQHAPRDPFRVLERLHSLAEIAARGAVSCRRPRNTLIVRVNLLSPAPWRTGHRSRSNASRLRGVDPKGIRIVVPAMRVFMFFAMSLKRPEFVSLHLKALALVKLHKIRKVALHASNCVPMRQGAAA